MDLKEIIEQKRAAAAKLRIEKKSQDTQFQTLQQYEEAQLQALPHQENIYTWIAEHPVPVRQVAAHVSVPSSVGGLVERKRKWLEPHEFFIDPTFPIQSPSNGPISSGPLSDNENLPQSGETTTTPDKSPRNSFAPDRKGPRKKAVWKSREVVPTTKALPDWYINTSLNQKFSRSDLQTISHIRALITNCIKTIKEGGSVDLDFLALRKKIHEMEFFEFVNAVLVKKSKILEEDGLTQIFDGPDAAYFPWDIRADAEALWLRWMGGDLDTSLLRGITVEKGILNSGKKRTSYKLQKDYEQRKSANVVGSNNLVNGQWWPSRICALRDGAHGEQEAGIHGQTGKGAYSIVISAGGYADKDNGENIEYCGTKSETSTLTRSTALLQDSFIKNQALRVLRAVNKKSKYAPKEGVRYDGLYQITDSEILDPATAMFRFSLKRIEGQYPIRFSGLEARPTDLELKERMKIRELLA